MMPMISASAVRSIAMRSAPALKPLTFSALMNLKRSPSARQCSWIGCQNSGSGVLLMMTHAFEIRIVQPRHRIERLLEHFRRLEIGRNVDRDFRHGYFRHQRRCINEPTRFAAKRDLRDLLDARERDDDQRHQQQSAEAEREGRSRHEVMPVPIGEHRGKPGADHIGGGCERCGLPNRHPGGRQNRHRQQNAHKQRDAGEPPMIGIRDRAGPAKFRLARSVEHSPIGADTAFEDFPGLVDGLDNVVVDAESFGARHKIAQHNCLLGAAGCCVLEIIARARPAEFGDHDAFAGIEAA
jgi:hypothetical protein